MLIKHLYYFILFNKLDFFYYKMMFMCKHINVKKLFIISLITIINVNHIFVFFVKFS